MASRSPSHLVLLTSVTLALLLLVVRMSSAHALPEPARYQMALEEYRQRSRRQRLFIIMLDGFRHDYLEQGDFQFPGFKKVMERGAKPEYLVPDFPTMSFPDYYSLMTGLHTKGQRAKENFLFDAARKEPFLQGSNPEQAHAHWWERGEPLWVTAEKQNRTCALYHWPGCEVEIRGARPTFCRPYSGVPSMDDFRNDIIKGLAQFQYLEADVVGIYFEMIDSLGHQYGPSSPRIKQVIGDLDPLMGYLAESLATPSLSDVNLMIVSDHGMTSISRKRVINLNDVLSPSDYDTVFTDVAVASVYAKPGKNHMVYQKLKHFHPNLTVFRKSDLPQRWRVRHGRYVAPLTAVADNGWFILGPDKQEFPKRSHDDSPMEGWHGFDNTNLDMMGLFIGMGPAFRRNVTSGPVQIVDLYQIMCYALDIQPSRNSGSWARVADLVTFEVACSHAPRAVTSPQSVVVMVVMTLVAVVFSSSPVLTRQVVT
ncbi:glycerophosphocholine cholinephosphodiesterase ENPP6-like [Babylonia areolata]|uniref:glycerophosphocholine cholinephosphodiesterase ENPP6-like n=1 Tax=Babylonia areolata TaxID=304850 RepID=UPI003FD067B4